MEQEIINTAATAAGTYGMSFREAWNYGGFIMWILLALSVIAGGLVIYMLIVLRRNQVAPDRLIGEISDSLEANDLSAARRACERHSTPLGAVVLAALNYIRATPRVDPALLRDIVEAEGARRSEDMQSQAQILLDIAALAPMLGLLGTVLGMLKAFSGVAENVAAAKPVVLAAGVSEAIITTIFGLIVAIPCMALYAYFRRHVTRLVSHLEAASAEILTALTRQVIQ